MAWVDFDFTPSDGLSNTTTFESKPTSGARAREQFMIILNQIKTFFNGTVKNTIDEHKAEYMTFKEDTENLISDIENFITDSEYQTPTISGTQIQLQKQSNTNILKFRLDEDVSGVGITISLDEGATSKPLVDIEGVAVTELSKGFVEVVENSINFTYAPKGAKLDTIITAVQTKGVTVADPKNIDNIVNAINSIDCIKNKANGVLKNNGTLAPSGTTTKRVTMGFRPNFIILYHRFNASESVYSTSGNRWLMSATPNPVDGRTTWYDRSSGANSTYCLWWGGLNIGAQGNDNQNNNETELFLSGNAIQAAYVDVTCKNTNNQYERSIGEIHWWAFRI